MATVLIIFAMIFVFGPIAKAYADRMSRELPPGAGVPPEEVARLREDVERLSAEVARLHEEQSFLVRLLSSSDQQRLLEGRQKSPD